MASIAAMSPPAVSLRNPKPTFLTLPVELRLEIYDLLLTVQAPDLSCISPVHPQILSVCHQTHEEALPFLYRGNMFYAHPSLLTSFPRLRPWYSPVVTNSVLPLIRRFHIRLRLDTDPTFTKETVTKAFSGVEELEVEVWQAMYQGATRDVLTLFEGIRGVKRAVVSGSVAYFGAYPKWLERNMMMPLGEVGDGFESDDSSED
ncbi:hypothetical protein BX600DRAFT_436556 [Xylariales sp. PMI_506]|nr:hypothetical protein BX600DRAFT_436556 [Xylariales sp. PMI_506]